MSGLTNGECCSIHNWHWKKYKNVSNERVHFTCEYRNRKCWISYNSI